MATPDAGRSGTSHREQAVKEKTDGRKTRSNRQETLVEQVRRRILEDIIQARIQPGSVLQLAGLADQYGVSRTPVREALSILEREGLVQAIAYKGYFVRSIEPGDVDDVFFMRRLLEGTGAELAAERASADVLERLGRVSPPVGERMTLVYDEYSHDFHRTIIEAAESPRLLTAFESVYNDVRRLQYAGIGSPRPDLIHQEHMEILECLVHRDPREARRRMEEHIDLIRTRALESWVSGR